LSEIQACLEGCDQALAEAEKLIARLDDFPAALRPEVSVLLARIAILRREMGRLRGVATVRARLKVHPDRTYFTDDAVPWPLRRDQGGV
jgi:hypothetical protein